MTPIVKDETYTSDKITVHQPSSGYRFSVEPFLLSSFIDLKNEKRIIDLGSGVGIIGIILSSKYKDINVTGIEIQEDLHKYAVKNIEESHLSKRMKNILGDFSKISEYFNKASFDIAVSNPPYRGLGAGRLNRESKRSIARHEVAGGVKDVIRATKFALKPKGRLFIIYSAERTSDLIFMLKESALEPKRMRFVHTKADRDAEMVMVEARFGGGAGLKVVPPLVIYGENNKYTEEVGKIIANNSQLPIDINVPK